MGDLDEDEEATKEESVDDENDDTDKKVDIENDPLYENIRFAREEKEDQLREKREKAQEVKAAKPKIDLRELVKQDLKKIVSSIDYDDEEKYEGGRKSQKVKVLHRQQQKLQIQNRHQRHQRGLHLKEKWRK